MSAFWRQVTSVPFAPTVRSRVKEQDDDEGVEGIVGALPVREDCTFEIVAESAPKDCKSEMIAATCDEVNAAACAIGAAASIEATIVRPVATAATFVATFLVIVITIVNFCKARRRVSY
jgi:hypothetical protein